MDTSRPRLEPLPTDSANPLNLLFFWWIKDLFWKGSHRDLDESDLYYPSHKDFSEKVGEILQREWQKETEKMKKLKFTLDKDGKKKPEKQIRPKLYKAIFRAFWPPYMIIGFFIFLQATVLKFIQPLFQGLIISYFEVDNDYMTQQDALLYAAGLIGSSAIIVLIMHHTNLQAMRIGMRVRVACSTLIYRKILLLSKAAVGQTAAGQVVNLLSNDVARFDQLPMFLHYLWIIPLQICLFGYAMWLKVGNFPTMVGLGSLLMLTIPVHSIVSVFSKHVRQKIAPLTDKRVEFMNEIIKGIQVVKMYAWEIPFAKIVSETRRAEIKKIVISSQIRGAIVASAIFTERLTLYITLVTYVMNGNTLKPSTSFVLATYFNLLQLSTALMFSNAMILYGEVRVSIRRIENFLLLDEISPPALLPPTKQKNGLAKVFEKIKENDHELNGILKTIKDEKAEIEESKPINVEMLKVSANWISGRLPPTLHNVSMRIKSGQLCALVGAVGSGKSSVLQVLLRELPLGAGLVKMVHHEKQANLKTNGNFIMDDSNYTISYASQEPWLFGGTVRTNILFGQPYNRKRYVEVVKVCALSKDFQQLPHGDMTIVGDRGSSLSGGQKARINLARAVYKDASIYLFDDPLSAVDARVSRHLFKKCINGYLRGKTRILVTHQLQFLKEVDHIVILDRGSVQLQGSYNQLLEYYPDITTILNNLRQEHENTEKDQIEKTVLKRRSNFKNLQRKASIASSTSNTSAMSEDDSGETLNTNKEIESRGHGNLPFKVYAKYFQSCRSNFSLVLLAFLLILTQFSSSGTDYWVSHWTNLEQLRSATNKSSSNLTNEHTTSIYSNNSFLAYFFEEDSNGLLKTLPAIHVYTFIIACCTILSILRSAIFMLVCMHASKNLHNAMFANLMQATMRFFHLNSSGRILNRFSKDVGSMDELLPKAMLEALQIFFVMCGILVMQVIINYWMALPLFLLGVMFCIIRSYYLRTAQNVKRLEGVTKSPVFGHVTTTMAGLPTIRSSGKDVQVLLQKEFDELQNVHSGAWFLTISTGTAFGLILDCVALCFITCVCLSFIFMKNKTTLGGDVGLALTQALIMIGTLQYGVRQTAEVIAQMTAVERILEYTNLPKEGPMRTDNPPPASWPTKGRLTIKNFSMRYDKDDLPVLKNLNINIEAGWKVGVIGRTGAGKSSLISALFRLFPDGTEGQISIDGRDTSTLGLQELRSRISIIPQEPVLFSQSLRYNLDPFHQYPDANLWDALHEVELHDYLLEEKVQQSGTNFSVGQRQLICLARAMLKNNRFLVLDEATANIDTRTDTLIQKTVRSKFENCTVITVAHRLNTIIDSDRIIVMEGGRIVEFGCPFELLCKSPNGPFAQMINKTGQAMSEELYKQAELACRKNTTQRSLDLTMDNSLNDDSPNGTEEACRM